MRDEESPSDPPLDAPSGAATGLPTNVLLDLAGRGDGGARNALFLRYRPAVERMARRFHQGRTHSAAFDDEDLVQETLAMAWEKLHEYRRESRFLLWLAQILRHQFISRRRHETREKRDVRKSRPLESSVAWASIEGGTPSASLREREEQERIESRMRRLTEEDREILALRYECGLSNDQLAEALGVTNEIARKRLSRARARLGILLGEETP
jgi:RNA polymerase sigma-70 factor (ECF subfamily)